MFVLPALITFISSFIAALIFTPIAIRLGIYLSIADIPGGRRKHARVTSRLGAVPLYIAFVIGIGIAQSFHLASNDQPNESWRLFGMLIGATIITGVGLLDDKIQLAARWQLVAQIICAVIAMLCLIFIQEFRSPFVNSPVVVFPVMVVILTMLWFVGMINTVNLLDGVDDEVAVVGDAVPGTLGVERPRTYCRRARRADGAVHRRAGLLRLCRLVGGALCAGGEQRADDHHRLEQEPRLLAGLRRLRVRR